MATRTEKKEYRFDFKLAPSFDIESERHLFRQWRSMWSGYENLCGLDAIDDAATKKRLRRQAFFLAVSKETLRIVQNLPVKDPDDLDELLSALESYILGKTNEVYERREFWKRTQREGESFADYMLSLREMTARCNFSKCCDRCEAFQLRDRVTTGIRDAGTIEKLLAVGSSLTLDTMCAICEADESAKEKCAVVAPSSISMIKKKTAVSAYKSERRRADSSAEALRPRTAECKFCGRQHELRKEQCPAFGKTCSKCKGRNHFAAKCRSKANDPGLGCLMASMTSQAPLIDVAMKAGRTDLGKIGMLADTGADICALPPSSLRTKPKMRRCWTRPTSAGGQRLSVAGCFDGCLTIGNIRHETCIYVINDLQLPVLSRSACVALKLVAADFPTQMIAPVRVREDRKASGPSKDDLLHEYADVFTDRVSLMKGETFSIKLKEDARPFCCNHVRRVAEPLKDKLKAELENLEAQDIIEKVTEPTEWCAPITVQPKKNGAVRLCVDLKKLNQHIVRERWLSPTPLEVVSSLPKNARFFTTVDAVKGYHQIPLNEASQALTTFITPFGRYKFKRAPFGISSISEHYNRRMYEIIADLMNTSHIVDDVIIADSDLDEHVKNVRAFLQKCRQNGVALNAAKFHFACPEVTFAGFSVNSSGYTVDGEMLTAIRDFPEPKNRTDLRSWFGLVNQVTSFTDELAGLLEPLRPLLREANEFLWLDEHRTHFDKAKAALCQVPYLAYYAPSRKTALYTDASRINGLGFVMTQQQDDGSWRVVRAGSRFLTDAESRYAMIELELLGIVWAVAKCRLMLEGMPHFPQTIDLFFRS